MEVNREWRASREARDRYLRGHVTLPFARGQSSLLRSRPRARPPGCPFFPGIRGADADPGRGHPPRARGPGPPRARGHRDGEDGGVRAPPPAAPAAPGPEPVGADARAHSGAGGAGGAGDPPLRAGHGRRGAPDLRRAVVPAAAQGPEARRRRGGRHARARARPRAAEHAEAERRVGSSCSTKPTRCWTWASRTTSTRSWPRPRSGRQTLLFSATLGATDRRDRAQAPTRPRRGAIAADAGAEPGDDAPGAADRLPRAPAPQAGRAGPGAGPGEPGGGARVLPHPERRGRARRGAERARLPVRGHARRHVAGGARPGHEEAAGWRHRPARGHRRGRARPRHRPPHARDQLRGAVGAGRLRAPHRPGRPSRPRGRGHHAGRSARARGCSATSSG